MASRRQEQGNDRRGNSRDRRARKLWLVKTFGNGVTAPCVHCERQLTLEEIEADRIIPGGSYRRNNIQVSCGPDNRSRSDKPGWVPPRLRNITKSQFVLV